MTPQPTDEAVQKLADTLRPLSFPDWHAIIAQALAAEAQRVRMEEQYKYAETLEQRNAAYWLIHDLSERLTGPETESLVSDRRRVADMLPIGMCPEWLLKYRSAIRAQQEEPGDV